jgi:uncharacterized protein (TIGR02118 family)
MIKVISAARRHPDLLEERFKSLMRVEHAPLIAQMPNLSGYVVNFAISGVPAPWDVVVELTFPDQAAFQQALASEAGQKALTHMRELVDMGTVVSGIFEVVGDATAEPR